ncbi:MAG: hypothetical protein O9311_08075 [Cytophagales bacterium]|nr:hypothetical protein [Cytophagales bacterium]
MADKYGSLTPYNYSFNMPNMVVDVNGADPADNGGRDPANYWFEESMQRRAAQGRGAPESNTMNYFDRLFTRGQMMEMFRTIGGGGGGISRNGNEFTIDFNRMGSYGGTWDYENGYRDFPSAEAALAFAAIQLRESGGWIFTKPGKAEMLQTIKEIGKWNLFRPHIKTIVQQFSLLAKVMQGAVAGPTPDPDPSAMMLKKLPILLARMYFNMPDAVSFAGGLEMVPFAGHVYSRGRIYGLTGTIRGKSTGFSDVGFGPGIDMGGGVNITEYYFINLTDKKYALSMSDFGGQRISVGGDINIFGSLSLGFGLSIAPVDSGKLFEFDTGMYIISKTYSYGVGVEGFPLNGNANFGATTLHNK